MLDIWPWLKPYIEIEGTSEDELKDMSLNLGLEWSSAIFGDVMEAYKKQYPHLTAQDTVGNISRVSFDDPLPDLFNPSKSSKLIH